MHDYHNIFSPDINRNDLEYFLSNTLIPDLLEWAATKKYDFTLVKFFHSKGLSFKRVQSLSEKFLPLKNSVAAAVEITKCKVLNANLDSASSSRLVKFLDSLCSSANSLPDSVIVFRPADSLLEQQYKNSIS